MPGLTTDARIDPFVTSNPTDGFVRFDPPNPNRVAAFGPSSLELADCWFGAHDLLRSSGVRVSLR